MALSSAKIIGDSPHIDRPFGWKAYYVTPDLLTGVVDVTVATLPAQAVVLDMKVVTIGAAGGVGVVNLALEVGATGVGDTVMLVDAADGGSTIGSITAINTPSAASLIEINAISLGGAPLIVNAQITYGGTELIPPTYGVFILCGRNEY